MITYLTCKSGFNEQQEWSPNAWINVTAPSMDETALLVDKFDIPQGFLNDIEDIEERPRLEVDEGWRMIVMRAPRRRTEDQTLFSTVPMGVVMKGDVFATICHYPLEMIDDYILFSRRKNHSEKNPNDLLLHLVLSSSVWYMKYLKYVNMETKDAEKHLERSVRNEELLELMRIERTLVYFITAIRGNEVMLVKLKSQLRQAKDSYDDDLLEDVEIEMQQARITANVHSDILAGMMDAFASVISNNLNQVMKRLTSASIILMAPTLIASFYGMNVPNGMEGNEYGFLIIVAVCLVTCAAMFLLFKKMKWF